MDHSVDDVNRNELDNLLSAEGNNDDIGNSDANIASLLQQLLVSTSSLQSSVDNINLQMNEMKDHRIDMQTDIDHLKKVVFNADMHGSLFNKPQHGHDNEAKNEERVQHDGADNDAGNDISNSKLDVGDNANNSNKPVLDKYSLNDDFDAEGYTFVNDDIDDDGNVYNNNEGHSVNSQRFSAAIFG